MVPPVTDGGGEGGGQRQQQQQQQQPGMGQMLTGIIRVAVFWYFASKFFSPKRPTDPNQPPTQISNLFSKGEHLVRFSASCTYFFCACLHTVYILLWREIAINQIVEEKKKTKKKKKKRRASERFFC